MPISFDECLTIVDQFKKSNRNLIMRREVHGVQIVQSGDKPIIEVLVTEAIHEESLRADEKPPSDYDYEFEGNKKNIGVRIAVRPIARAQTGAVCQPGDSASGDPSAYYGTSDGIFI